MPIEEIEAIKNQFVKSLNPLAIYLFGSFANGTEKEDSDFDFYIVMDNGTKDVKDLAADAYYSLKDLDRKRPVDILIGTEEKFNRRKTLKLSIERQVNDNGIIIYESRDKRLA